MKTETSSATKTAQPRYLDKTSAADLFGVSPRTLDSWMARRLVPFYRIGRTIRFDPDDIQKHLQGNHRVGGGTNGAL